MYEDYNDVEIVTKDVEYINEQAFKVLDDQDLFLKEFAELKKKFIGGDDLSTKEKDNSIVSSSESYEEGENSLTEQEKQMLFVPESN